VVEDAAVESETTLTISKTNPDVIAAGKDVELDGGSAGRDREDAAPRGSTDGHRDADDLREEKDSHEKDEPDEKIPRRKQDDCRQFCHNGHLRRRRPRPVTTASHMLQIKKTFHIVI